MGGGYHPGSLRSVNGPPIHPAWTAEGLVGKLALTSPSVNVNPRSVSPIGSPPRSKLKPTSGRAEFFKVKANRRKFHSPKKTKPNRPGKSGRIFQKTKPIKAQLTTRQGRPAGAVRERSPETQSQSRTDRHHALPSVMARELQTQFETSPDRVRHRILAFP